MATAADPSGERRKVAAVRTLRAKTIEERFAEIETLLRELRDDVAQIPRPPAASVVVAIEQWVQGYGWDGTFSDEMAVEEFGRIARRLNSHLDAISRERLLQLWRSEKARRTEADAARAA
jgi:hypothetical protein